MADRTSAEIFGNLFQWLAEKPESAERNADAAKVWQLSRGYDFSPCQMEAEDALLSLGLARRVPNTEHPDEGDYVIVYGPETHTKGAAK